MYEKAAYAAFFFRYLFCYSGAGFVKRVADSILLILECGVAAQMNAGFNIMRFARFKFNEHTELIIDAREHEFPLNHILIKEEPLRRECIQSLSVKMHDDYQSLPLFCVYGVFLPNDSLADDDLAGHLESLSRHKLMTFAETDVSRPQCPSAGLLEIVAPVITEPDSLRKIPIAALVHAANERELVGSCLNNGKVGNKNTTGTDRKSGQVSENEGRSYFLCFDNLDPFTNFLSRPGIFFFKTAKLIDDKKSTGLADQVDMQMLHDMFETPLL